MSNGRPFRRRTYQPPTDGGIVSMSTGVAMAEHLRPHLDLIGCTCDAEVRLGDLDCDGIRLLHLAHDDWCPLLDLITRQEN